VSSQDKPDILNIDQAAELLGVSVKTFNKVLHAQDLPARKIGREWKFSRQALIDWVGSGRSSKFYRETAEEEGEAAASEPPEEPSREPTRQPARQGQGRARRTAGWNIEY
jgi:excisionase family DNA binding protein